MVKLHKSQTAPGLPSLRNRLLVLVGKLIVVETFEITETKPRFQTIEMISIYASEKKSISLTYVLVILIHSYMETNNCCIVFRQF